MRREVTQESLYIHGLPGATVQCEARIPSTPITLMAIRLLRLTARDYCNRRRRAGIERWMAGAGALWPFDQVCAVLRIKDVQALKNWVRYAGKQLVEADQEESAAG